MSPTLDQLSALRGKPVMSDDGQKLGALDQVYYDEDSGEPRWVQLSSGFMGMRQLVVPVNGAYVQDVELHVPFTKDEVANAPEPEEIKALSPEFERALADYFGVTERTFDRGEANGADVDLELRITRVWIWPESSQEEVL